MLKIEVKSVEVQTKEGTSKRGKPYSMRTQYAWAHLGKAYPEEVRITLGDDQAPFAPGFYTLSPKCFHLNQWGEVAVDLRQMVPIAGAGAAKAS